MKEMPQTNKFPQVLSKKIKNLIGIEYDYFFENYPDLQNSFLTYLFKYIFNLFEKRFQVRLYIELPDSLRIISADTWSLAPIVNSLKRAGIISHVEQLPTRHDEPTLLRYFSLLPGLSRYNSLNGLGHSFLSTREALIASISEAVERYCYRDFLPPAASIKRSSYKAFSGRAIDPSTIVGVTKEVRNQSDNVFLNSYSSETEFTWIKGRSLLTERDTWLPLHLVTFNPILRQEFLQRREPMIRETVSTGAAVGCSKTSAIYRGLCEVVERDAFMITYLNKLTPPQIPPASLQNPSFSFIKRQLHKHGLKLFLLQLPTDFPVHVVMAYIQSKQGRGLPFSLGFKTDLSLETACYGAVKEALNSRIALQSMKEYYQRIDSSAEPKAGLFEDWFFRRAHPWLTNPAWEADITFLIKGHELETNEVKVFSPANDSYRKKLLFLNNFIKSENIEAVYIENTTKNLLLAGKESNYPLRSFFVVMPTLQPMHLIEEFACYGGERLKSVPGKLGYKIDQNFINKHPHPIV